MRSILLPVLVSLAVLVLASAAGAGGATKDDGVRVTVFGDSVATAMEYDPSAKQVLARGIDLQLETAPCRRLGDTSCPYDGIRPPNVIDRATQLGTQLGPVVVVVVGYNDYEANYAENIDDAMAVFRKAGVQHVLWATLLEERQSWANMNDTIRRILARTFAVDIDLSLAARKTPFGGGARTSTAAGPYGANAASAA